ncbi:IucA/IucC family protein [Catenovulum adriaticum]|uniref:Short-chain oxidoreductase n=1 Tax=Catenovulum adriaticum TaxID=2984846 RepID=A0ABY7AHV1_9ALTE|nr:IucA/IucC family protein [Catenovulum sp. TS8]WAJ69183.1 short-chain oxidoreductase [Catenovulum sp. TS8]
MEYLNANQLAENASFQAFTNCYLREIDCGVWHSSQSWQQHTGVQFNPIVAHALELQLTDIKTSLVLAVSYRSTVGRHQITQVYCKRDNDWSWQAISFLSACLMLIDNIYANKTTLGEHAKDKLELLNRMLESQQIMADYLNQRQQDESLNTLDFIASEQSLLFGHWMHPTPKSRQGIHSWQHKNYTPELKAKFQLHFFAVSKSLLKFNSSTTESVAQIITQIAQTDSHSIDIDNDKQLVPVHPLQAHWLLHQDNIKQLLSSGQLVDLGTMGHVFTPTSSVRTLYCPDLDYMVKLSIPVKITNSLRKNMAHELEPGLSVGKLIAGSNFNLNFPQFTLIEDPAYITVSLPDQTESGFETIIRRNPFTKQSSDANPTLSIAALVQDPIHQNAESKLAQSVKALASQKHLSTKTASLLWFDSYWHCAIEPAIWLYENHGVALEAHQQNSLLTLNHHCPSQYYYRDNQGFYLSAHMKTKLQASVPELKRNPDLFYEDEMIIDRFGYYLFINQLFSIISRFGQDDLISEQQLLAVSYQKLNTLRFKLKGAGANFVDNAFNQPLLASKANLLTRVADVDELEAEQELAVYSQFKNPFYPIHLQAKTHHPLTQNKKEYACA